MGRGARKNNTASMTVRGTTSVVDQAVPTEIPLAQYIQGLRAQVDFVEAAGRPLVGPIVERIYHDIAGDDRTSFANVMQRNARMTHAYVRDTTDLVAESVTRQDAVVHVRGDDGRTLCGLTVEGFWRQSSPRGTWAQHPARRCATCDRSERTQVMQACTESGPGRLTDEEVESVRQQAEHALVVALRDGYQVAPDADIALGGVVRFVDEAARARLSSIASEHAMAHPDVAARQILTTFDRLALTEQLGAVPTPTRAEIERAHDRLLQAGATQDQRESSASRELRVSMVQRASQPGPDAPAGWDLV